MPKIAPAEALQSTAFSSVAVFLAVLRSTFFFVFQYPGNHNSKFLNLFNFQVEVCIGNQFVVLTDIPDHAFAILSKSAEPFFWHKYIFFSAGFCELMVFMFSF